MSRAANPTMMPYGRLELEAVGRVLMSEGAILAALITVLSATAVTKILEYSREHHRAAVTKVVVVPWHNMPAPPSLQIAPPAAPAGVTAAPPSVGIPVPVPDARAPTEAKLATQAEINSSGTGPPGSPTGAEQIVVADAPPLDDAPVSTAYVYRDEEPMIVHSVLPKYPELARKSGLEGQLLLNVLVGTDGNVKKIEIVKGDPLLNDAAIEAVQQYKFRPALANNRPVAVWIALPIRFQLGG
jgi:protein TonB